MAIIIIAHLTKKLNHIELIIVLVEVISVVVVVVVVLLMPVQPCDLKLFIF